jgi:uncharacterized protein YndB with AHSA1/START domain
MPDEQVTRSVDLESDVDEVWRAVADPGERALWLDDPDAAARRVRVDEVDAGGAADPGRRLTWTWWHPGDEGAASTVSVVLAPLAAGAPGWWSPSRCRPGPRPSGPRPAPGPRRPW